MLSLSEKEGLIQQLIIKTGMCRRTLFILCDQYNWNENEIIKLTLQ